MTREERISQWHETIEQQASIGISGAAFCREHGINPSRFYLWHKRLKDDASGGFLELRTDPFSSKPGPATAGVLVHVNGAVCTELAPGFDADQIRGSVYF